MKSHGTRDFRILVCKPSPGGYEKSNVTQDLTDITGTSFWFVNLYLGYKESKVT